MAASIASCDAAVADFNTKLDAFWLAAIELCVQELALDKQPILAGDSASLCSTKHTGSRSSTPAIPAALSCPPDSATR
jgi:hypothetical protein